MKYAVFNGLIYIIILTLFSSCGSNSRNPMEKNLPKLIENPEQENPDFYFRIISMEESDSSYLCMLKSMNLNDTVGMEMEIMKGINPGINEDGTPDLENGFYENKIKFLRTNKLTSQFISAMTSQYKIDIQHTNPKDIVKPIVFSSNKKTIDFTKDEIYALKLFFKNSIGAEAEIFARIDWHRRLFEFKPKDQTYFKSFVDSFINSNEED